MMSRQEIIKKFMERGNLLTPELLEKIREKNIDELLKKKHTELVIEKIHLDNKKDEIKIIKNITSIPTELTKNDFINFYNSKYEKIRKIITEKYKDNFISINQINRRREDVFVIGIIRDIKNNEKTILEVEDPTGNITIIFDEKHNLEQDDVLGFYGISAGDLIYGKKIIYPDVPLRKPSTGHGKACFVSDLHIDESPPTIIENFFKWFEGENIKYLFIAGDVGDDAVLEKYIQEYCYNKKVIIIPGNIDGKYPQLPKKYNKEQIISLSNPSMIELNGIKILISHDMNMTMLKKRCLGKSEAIFKEDVFVIEEVPDVVHFGHTHKTSVENYKSITFVNSGSPLNEFKPVVIDFSNRDVKQVVI